MTITPGRKAMAFAVGGLLVAGTVVAVAIPASRRAVPLPTKGAASTALAARAPRSATGTAAGGAGGSGPAGTIAAGSIAGGPAGSISSDAAGSAAGAGGTAGAAAGISASGTAGGAASAPAAGAAGAPQIASVGPLADTPVVADTVVRTGSVDVEVAKGHFADAFSAAADVARQVGGFVVATQMSTQVGPVPLGAPTPDIAPAPGPTSGAASVFPSPIGRSDVPSGTLALRIPGARFDDARRSLEHLGTVRAEQLSGQDAGGQIADLGARLADLHAAQDGLRALAAKAASTAEVLQVQSQLNAVQQQIDGINAQLDRLHNAVALATIDVRVTEPIPVLAAPHPRTVLQLRLAQAGRGVQAVVGGTIVAAAYAVPFGVLVLLGLATLNAARRRRAPRVPVV